MTIDNKRTGDIITLQMAVGPPRNPATWRDFDFISLQAWKESLDTKNYFPKMFF